jgi:hypothetical protein
MTTNHTPTPWVVNHQHASRANDAESVIEQEGGSNAIATIHEIYTLSPGGSHRHANAAHIVRCVNAYDELVAALEEIDRIALSHPYAAMTCGDVANIARAVLAKVQA